jgi:predicted ester cyclase
MADEAGLLLQLGAQLPRRKDGRLIAPPVTDAGEDGDAVLQRLLAMPPVSREDRNKVIIARSKSSAPAKEDRAPGYQQRRLGLQHLREYGNAHGVGKFTPTLAFPGRNDRITGLLAEGEKVWMQFNLRGTHQASFYGLPPTGKRVEMPEVGIMRVVDGKWTESWYFGDELGILLQLGAVQMLLG